MAHTNENDKYWFYHKCETIITVDSLEVTMSEASGYFQTSYVLGHFEHSGSTFSI
jgi:hypothetical protein